MPSVSAIEFDFRTNEGRWRLVLDEEDEQTPAMVYAPDGSSATYHCAIGEYEVLGLPIPADVYRWLDSFDGEVDEVFSLARKDWNP